MSVIVSKDSGRNKRLKRWLLKSHARSREREGTAGQGCKPTEASPVMYLTQQSCTPKGSVLSPNSTPPGEPHPKQDDSVQNDILIQTSTDAVSVI